MRTGLLAQKMGMSRLYSADGSHIPVTILKVENCQVVAQRTEAKNGYNALQVGIGGRKVSRTTKPLRGQYAKAKVAPKAKLGEFRVAADALVEVGATLTVDHFVVGQTVDVQGTTIGHGFTGAMRRWNFAGLEATHGVSVSHRSHGSTGQRQDPGRVFKGKKMAGHYGVETVTIQNLSVVKVDVEQGLLFISGAVPGHEGSFVRIKDAAKVARPKDAPYPAAFKAAEKQNVTVEVSQPSAPEAAAPAAEAAPAQPSEEPKA